MTDAQDPDPTLPEDHGLSRARPVAPGLHLIATPIGAARDITLKALDILAQADVLAAEDTRSLRRLMEIHGIRLGDRPLVPYHDHNGPQMRPRLLEWLAQGRSVAYASEAGTPLVADPGFQLARAVIEAGLPVWSAPGPSAVLAALTVAGLPSDRFCFAGFLPAQGGARKTALAELLPIPATLVLYESPKRINRLLDELCDSGAGSRQAALCRELTKRFEDVKRGTVSALRDALHTVEPRGEIVLVLDRAAADAVVSDEALDTALRAALAQERLRDAVDRVAADLRLPRRRVYQRALELDGK